MLYAECSVAFGDLIMEHRRVGNAAALSVAGTVAQYDGTHLLVFEDPHHEGIAYDMHPDVEKSIQHKSDLGRGGGHVYMQHSYMHCFTVQTPPNKGTVDTKKNAKQLCIRQ